MFCRGAKYGLRKSKIPNQLILKFKKFMKKKYILMIVAAIVFAFVSCITW